MSESMGGADENRLKGRPPVRIDHGTLVRQLGPFVATALTAWVAVVIGSHMDWPEYVISVAVLLAAWGYGLVTGLRGHVLTGTVLGSLVFLVALALMRDSAGGSLAAVSIVTLLPMFQTALYVRDRLGLWIVLAGIAVFYLAPLVFIGPPRYPTTGYRGALLGILVSSIVGLATHRLVADIRRRASEARHRERILTRVNDAVQQLYRSPDPRHDACRVVRDLSDALVVGLYEPDPVTRSLTTTTTTRTADADSTGAVARPGSAVDDAFRTRQPQFLSENIESRVGNVALWRAEGAPRSALYQPLLHAGQPVGVLFVGWSDRVTPTETRVAVSALVAHEIAAVLARQDVIDQLTDEALTDPLTGLPNRRAWDLQIGAAMSGGPDPVSVAMIDIDRFKQFNDAHGHPAGDALLRKAAAAWRAETRTGDFLARLGGEEFALLLTGKDAAAAHALVERLRGSMPDGQTVSVGIALREEGDTPNRLLARADEALYAAKAGGRDRAVVAAASSPG
ncbi:MAG TPA: sensor domain-containing diguanylate cyclase [Solirubrobacteraceae bacterium]|nr:sensor domain-containing diguanylate cyclase [Solirubrobacteraceae bacterium]